MRWQLEGVSYIVSERHELWSTNGLKLDCHFHPPYINCDSNSLPGFAGDQQTKLNQTLLNDGQ